MSMLEWAKKEVEIAKAQNAKADNDDADMDMSGYINACYDSALKAYESLMNDDHSGMSFSITVGILTRLLHEEPLTPIEDTEDMWNESDETDTYRCYQCHRMSSLFKYVDKSTGVVTYKDINRCVFKETDTGLTSTFGLATKLIDDRFPITMPYSPHGHYTIFGTSFATTGEQGCFDTVFFEKLKYPNGHIEALYIPFKEDNGTFVQIDHGEYIVRRTLHDRNKSNDTKESD